MTATLQRAPRKSKREFDPDFRFTVAQYQKMVAEGIISADARVELLNGKVVNKMARNPPHDTTLTLTQDELMPLCPSDWYIRVQMAIIAGSRSQPEPDIAVVRRPANRYAKQHPTAKDIGMLAEIGDSTLLAERRAKAPLYAGARVPWFWIVNVQDKTVEVYSDPKGGATPEYRKHHDYKIGERVPVVLNGKTVGHVEVSKLFPEEVD